MRTRPARPEHQRGAALFMALIFLLVLTILGVFGMNVSRMENMMAGNSQSQAETLSESELALRETQETVDTITEDGTEGDPNFDLDNEYYYDGEVDPATLDWSSITHATTSNGTLYVIEYDDPPWEGNSVKFGGSGVQAHLFRITAQTTAGRGARRTAQVVYGTDNAP